jgi:hypothetical protein
MSTVLVDLRANIDNREGEWQKQTIKMSDSFSRQNDQGDVMPINHKHNIEKPKNINTKTIQNIFMNSENIFETPMNTFETSETEFKSKRYINNAGLEQYEL